MATKKNENKKSLKFIDILNDFREGKEIDVLSFIEDRDIQEIESIVGDVLLGISILNKNIKDTVSKEVNSQMAIFFYGLLQCTSLEVEKEDITLENYDLKLEDCILKNSYSARKMKEIILNVLQEEKSEVLNLLVKEFKNIPNEDNLIKLQERMDKMFNNRSSEDLKMINNILDYNDPTLKMIKEMIYSSVKDNEGLIQDGNNNAKG